MSPIRLKHAARAALAAAAVSLVAASPAAAAKATCPGATSQPFLPWGDVADYQLMPGGSFEGTPGWTLSAGARVAAGSEPFDATGAAGAKSLSLVPGASATSPPVCLTADHGSFRFFAKAMQGDGASLRVEVLADSPTQVIDLGAVTGTTAWAPTSSLTTGVDSLVLDADGTTQVRFRFTADSGKWQVDDVYVDPWRHGG